VPAYQTIEELETAFGERLRALRLERNLDQVTLAGRAGVAVNALKNLESGRGTLRTLVRILKALDRESVLELIAPVAVINPLLVKAPGQTRQRARKRKS
jgi:transcriptional regulator with XRE-family HTH domain